MSDQAQRLRELSNTQKNHRIIAVTSGKGGVGKTNLSVNLGISLAQLGGQVLLLDADLGMANVDLILGVTPKYTLQHVFAHNLKLNDVLITGPYNMKIIPGVSGAMGLTDLTEEDRNRFMLEVHELEMSLQSDYIIIDTSAGMSQTVLNFVLAADEILLVVTPEPTSMMDAYAILKNIVKQNPDANIKTIVNMAKTKQEAEYVFNTLKVISEKFLSYEPQYIGYVLRDDAVLKSVREQQPFIIKHPYAPASVCVKSLANKLASVTPPVASLKGIKRLFEKALFLSRV